MERISYKIVSRILKADGTPEFSKSGTTADITYTIKFHQFHLARHTHPDPDMSNYAIKHGPNCFEYIVDPIEKAIINPKKEVRAKTKV